MAFEVRFLDGAEEDLFAIYVHIAERDGIDRADALDRRLRAACLRLREFPARGTAHDELASGLRSIPFERRATIFYRVVGESVEIVRILYAGRETGRAFSGT